MAEEDCPVIFPIHPRTKAAIEQFGFQDMLQNQRLKIIEPLGFWDTQALIRNAKMVITDSGGVVKEAYFHQVRCIIPDTQIEWIEAVKEGWTYLESADANKIIKRVHHFPTPSFIPSGVQSHFLGNGTAANKIVEHIFQFLNKKYV